MDTYEEYCQDLRFGVRLMFQEMSDPWGHIAVRLPASDGRQGFMLKYVRAPRPPADPDAILIFDYDGKLLEGERTLPWEIPLYTGIFAARPDIQSVVHAHPHVATALSMADKTIFAITHQSAPFGHGMPVFPGDMIHTPELGAGLAATLGQEPAALLKGHGAVAVGETIGGAVETMLRLEQAARQQVWAATLGTPQMLEDRLLAFHTDRNAFGQGSLAMWYTKRYYMGG
jgi:ribulose-5-phosphate 4-epimerase/fuculose-1-phosphate aldolase